MRVMRRTGPVGLVGEVGLEMAVSVAGPRASEGWRAWVDGSCWGCEGGGLVVVVVAGAAAAESGCEGCCGGGGDDAEVVVADCSVCWVSGALSCSLDGRASISTGGGDVDGGW